MPAAADRADLIAAAQAGQPAALDALLRVSQADARRHCQANDVDDAVQEALLRLTRHIGRSDNFELAFAERLLMQLS